MANIKRQERLSSIGARTLDTLVTYSYKPVIFPAQLSLTEEEVKFRHFIDDLAFEYHKNDTRSTGGPYDRHISGVARIIDLAYIEAGSKPPLIAYALAKLHDVVDLDPRVRKVRRKLIDLINRRSSLDKLSDEEHITGLINDNEYRDLRRETRNLGRRIKRLRGSREKTEEHGLIEKLRLPLYERITNQLRGYSEMGNFTSNFREELERAVQNTAPGIKALTRYTELYNFEESVDFLFDRIDSPIGFTIIYTRLADVMYNTIDWKKRIKDDFYNFPERSAVKKWNEGEQLSLRKIISTAGFKTSIVCSTTNAALEDYHNPNNNTASIFQDKSNEEGITQLLKECLIKSAIEALEESSYLQISNYPNILNKAFIGYVFRKIEEAKRESAFDSITLPPFSKIGPLIFGLHGVDGLHWRYSSLQINSISGEPSTKIEIMQEYFNTQAFLTLMKLYRNNPNFIVKGIPRGSGDGRLGSYYAGR